MQRSIAVLQQLLRSTHQHNVLPEYQIITSIDSINAITNIKFFRGAFFSSSPTMKDQETYAIAVIWTNTPINTSIYPVLHCSINVTFTDEKDGSTKTVKAPLGESLLEVAHSNEIDLEGACEGSLACSTCHVVVEDQAYYDKLPEPDDDENDMLDLAFGLTNTSRLGCQIKASKELDGLKVRIPSATRNFAVDGHVPKPH